MSRKRDIRWLLFGSAPQRRAASAFSFAAVRPILGQRSKPHFHNQVFQRTVDHVGCGGRNANFVLPEKYAHFGAFRAGRSVCCGFELGCGVTLISSVHGDGPYLLVLVGLRPDLQRQISEVASQARWRVAVCEHSGQLDIRQGSDTIRKISAVLVEVPASNADAARLVREVKTQRPDVPLIVLASPTSTSALVRILRSGADGIIALPLTAERVMQNLRAIATSGLPDDSEVLPLLENPQVNLDFASIIGTDSTFLAAVAQAAVAARGHGHVLLEGETGTGKKMLAKAMHAASPRAMMPVHRMSLRELAPRDVESTVFGHEKGAFPGAFEQRTGLLQQCDGGTLILDAIDRLPSSGRQRLATSIMSRRVSPLGANYSLQANVRIIALSHRPLSKLVESGAFDSELYNVLSGTRIVLPPLRKRPSDIALLARQFLAKVVDEAGLDELVLSSDAVASLQAFPWPGNVRQLHAALLRAAALSPANVLTASDFPHLNPGPRIRPRPSWRPISTFQSPDSVDLYTNDGNLRRLSEIEADVIRLAIKHYRGQITKAARQLGIGRSTLYRKMAELGLEDTSA